VRTNSRDPRMIKIEETLFAPAERARPEELKRLRKVMLDHPLIRVVLEAVQGHVLILNEHRQILAANDGLLEALSRESDGCLIGLRPGEVFGCIHFTEGPGGCGTAANCRFCGAVLTLLASQMKGEVVTGECRLSRKVGGRMEAVDLKIRATPLEINGRTVTAFVLHDVSALKRRDVLEQVLFHDLSNTIGGIEGWSALLQEVDTSKAAQHIVTLSRHLRSEVQYHQTLARAERNELVVEPRRCEVSEVLRDLRGFFPHHEQSSERHLEFAEPDQPREVETDPVILRRVLINMVKNALEASPASALVHVSTEMRGRRMAFVVHNTGVVPSDVRPHIFERSFSTKGPGRGIGCYTMKLLGETYLGGEVGFASEPSTGTRFWILLPERLSRSATVRSPLASEPLHRSLPREAPSDTPKKSRARPRLLLVDDDEIYTSLCEALLSRLGFDVEVAHRPDEAWKRFAADPNGFTVVLTDLSMPHMSGTELARRISNMNTEIPIILSTGIDEEMGAELARAAGVRHVMVKPCTREHFAEEFQAAGIAVPEG